MKYNKFDVVEVYIPSRLIWAKGMIIDISCKNNKIIYKVEFNINNKTYIKNVKKNEAKTYLKLIEKSNEFMSTNISNSDYCHICQQLYKLDELTKDMIGNLKCSYC